MNAAKRIPYIGSTFFAALHTISKVVKDVLDALKDNGKTIKDKVIERHLDGPLGKTLTLGKLIILNTFSSSSSVVLLLFSIIRKR